MRTRLCIFAEVGSWDRQRQPSCWRTPARTRHSKNAQEKGKRIENERLSAVATWLAKIHLFCCLLSTRSEEAHLVLDALDYAGYLLSVHLKYAYAQIWIFEQFVNVVLNPKTTSHGILGSNEGMQSNYTCRKMNDTHVLPYQRSYTNRANCCYLALSRSA